jgi:hypothetical protein
MLRNLDPRIVAVTALGSSLLVFAAPKIISDKRAWVAYGSGGTPPTWLGYARITLLRAVSYLFPRDLSNGARISAAESPQYLGQLPGREGVRPAVTHWFLPQRQAPHEAPPSMHERTQSLCRRYADAYPDLLRVDPSETEGRSTDAIYAKRADMPGRNPAARHWALGDEIAHGHTAEGSLHVWCSDADAKQIVEKGWGLLFPLAPMRLVPAGWVFVYAPRNDEELEIVDQIFRAGIANLTGAMVNRVG